MFTLTSSQVIDANAVWQANVQKLEKPQTEKRVWFPEEKLHVVQRDIEEEDDGDSFETVAWRRASLDRKMSQAADSAVYYLPHPKNIREQQVDESSGEVVYWTYGHRLEHVKIVDRWIPSNFYCPPHEDIFWEEDDQSSKKWLSLLGEINLRTTIFAMSSCLVMALCQDAVSQLLLL